MPTKPPPVGAVKVFCSYAHLDENLRDKLERQLSPLLRTGQIENWHDRKIKAGEKWRGKIDDELNSAHNILLLVSPDFIASDYCYKIEMTRALERHENGEARVVPVILRPCNWQKMPFAEIQVLPANAQPVTTWTNEDEAFLSAAKGIEDVVEALLAKPSGPTARAATTSAPQPVSLPPPPVVGFAR